MDFLGILSGLPMLLFLPKLEEKFGKWNILFLSIAIYLAGNALILMNQTSVAFQLTGLVITGLGIYGTFGTVFAMQPDAIDYSEWKKNRSISGTIAAFQSLFVKASMGLASWIIGLYLVLNGYNGAASTQGLAAQQSIQFCYMWIPSFCASCWRSRTYSGSWTPVPTRCAPSWTSAVRNYWN